MGPSEGGSPEYHLLVCSEPFGRGDHFEMNDRGSLFIAIFLLHPYPWLTLDSHVKILSLLYWLSVGPLMKLKSSEISPFSSVEIPCTLRPISFDHDSFLFGSLLISDCKAVCACRLPQFSLAKATRQRVTTDLRRRDSCRPMAEAS